jgi:hypothetical protein
VQRAIGHEPRRQLAPDHAGGAGDEDVQNLPPVEN